MNKTEQIFSSNCPYNNCYQTNAKRLLFVCTAGMLRSPTAQVVASGMGFNARACGSDSDVALIPLSVNLINWADKIFFVNFENYQQALETFEVSEYDEDIKKKAVVWDIPDNFNWGDQILFNLIRFKLENFMKEGKL
jgi:predicted protein tyrosine phosphatase